MGVMTRKQWYDEVMLTLPILWEQEWTADSKGPKIEATAFWVEVNRVGVSLGLLKWDGNGAYRPTYNKRAEPLAPAKTNWEAMK